MEFYKNKEEVIAEFLVDPKIGLTDEQVLKQRELYGENKLPEEEEDSHLKLFLRVLRNLLLLCCLVLLHSPL